MASSQRILIRCGMRSQSACTRIQRTFLLDSGAMDTITNQLRIRRCMRLRFCRPWSRQNAGTGARDPLDLPVVGGGLIQTMKEVEELLAQGLSAVSTSKPQMWISIER